MKETAATMVNESIENLPLYNSGLSVEHVKAKYGLDTVSKLGSNENPYGASPKVVDAATSVLDTCFRYPDTDSVDLIAAISKRLNVARDKVVVGNGSEELIVIASRALLGPQDTMLTVSPDFGLHTIHAMAMGASVRQIPFCSDYSFDVESIIGALKERPKLLCLSTPSNPVGTYLTGAEVNSIAEACGTHTLFLLDEAYYEYASSESGYPDCLSILRKSGCAYLLLRTFSKAYGLAGLRIGYGIVSTSNLTENMNRIRTPFNINHVAQTAALTAYLDQDFMENNCGLIKQARSIISERVSSLGYSVAPSAANFLFIDTGHDAIIVAEEMLKRGVIVKPWTSPDYQTFIRVSIGSDTENLHFIEAFENTMNRIG